MSHERGWSAVGSDLLRGVLRGLAIGALLALAPRSPYPASSVLYASLVAAPLSVAEGAIERGRFEVPALLGVTLGWAVVFVALFCAHFQAVSARGVIGSGSFDGGFAALSAEATRLGTAADDNGGGLDNLHWDAMLASALAAGLVSFTLVPVPADAFRRRGHPRLPSFLGIAFGSIGSATVLLMGVIAVTRPASASFAWVVGILISIEAFFLGIVIVIGRTVADRMSAGLLELSRRSDEPS